VQVLMSARASARHRKLDLASLVVDEILVLRAQYLRKRVMFRAKGGVNMPRSARSHLFVRLREVPGACMKTQVLRPWWERRYKHRKPRRQGPEEQVTSRQQALEIMTASKRTHSGAA
jgi:Ribosomal protein L22p/L17e